MPIKTPRKAKQPDQTELVLELIMLVREQMKGQNQILTAAMEAQKSSADVLAKWMGMFTPSPSPLKGSSMEDREIMREQMELETEWEPLNFDGPLLSPEEFGSN